jgi:glutaminyl-peptide cyclotransferase
MNPGVRVAFWSACLCGAACLNGCVRRAADTAAQGRAAVFSGERALSEASAFVALGSRDAGTEGAERAARWLAERLRSIGVDPVTDTFEDSVPHGSAVFRNVLGEIRRGGRGVAILISHYDTKAGIAGGFVGANDSGSSTGLLLALADALVRERRAEGPDILVAFLDGEECRVAYGPSDGLHGSRRLAATLVRNGRAANVKAVIVMDMVGDRDLNVSIPRNSTPSLISRVFEAARAQGTRLQFSLANGAIVDDHAPILAAGMPAIDLIDFEYGSAPGRNDYWHTPRDTMDKLSAGSLQVVGDAVLGVLRELR